MLWRAHQPLSPQPARREGYCVGMSSSFCYSCELSSITCRAFVYLTPTFCSFFLFIFFLFATICIGQSLCDRPTASSTQHFCFHIWIVLSGHGWRFKARCISTSAGTGSLSGVWIFVQGASAHRLNQEGGSAGSVGYRGYAVCMLEGSMARHLSVAIIKSKRLRLESSNQTWMR
jgi:hypothetical protein